MRVVPQFETARDYASSDGGGYCEYMDDKAQSQAAGDVALSPELSDCIQRLRAILTERLEIITALIAVAIEHPSASVREEAEPLPTVIAQVLPLMLQALGSSSNTIIKLCDAPTFQTRDCYSIVRSIVEMATNLCYIIGKGPEAAERALRHARQKAYRDMERRSRIGNSAICLQYAQRPHPSTVAGLEEEMAEFTSRQGREISWTEESIDERIESAGRDLGDTVLTPLHWARFAVYRHSSEILHGSLFSALYFFGLTQSRGPRSVSEAVEFCGEQQMLLLLATGLSLQAVTAAFHLRYGFRAAHERSSALTKSMASIPLFARSAPPSDPAGSSN